MPSPMKLVPGDFRIVASTVIQHAATKNTVIKGWSGFVIRNSAAPVNPKKMKSIETT